MKHNPWQSAGNAAVVALMLSIGASFSMVTGFELTVSASWLIVACCLTACAASAAFCLKRGGWLVLGLWGIAVGYFWRQGQAWEQLLQLIQRISYVYDKAYHWGALTLTDAPWDAGRADLPMGILAGAVATAAAWSICRGKSGFFPALLSLLPLWACVVVTDTVPASWALYLLLLGLILLILPGEVRRNSPVQGRRLTAAAALPAAFLLAFIFWLMPRDGYENHAQQVQAQLYAWISNIPETAASAAQRVTVVWTEERQPEKLRLDQLGRRIQSTATVMEVTAETDDTLYLRGQDYDRYDGTGWQITGSRVEAFASSGPDLGRVSIRTAALPQVLYVPCYPGGGVTLTGGSVSNTWEQREYSFRRTGPPSGWQEAEDLPNGNGTTEYLDLPENTRREARELLAAVLTGEETIVETARKIGDYVRGCARYDLNPSRMDSEEEDFALWFLQEAEAGYCMHFASSAVVLLRAAGVEARYVSGYMIRAEAGQTVPVTGENAHAWAEYYVPSLDIWLVLEATPADPDASQQTGETSATAPSQEETAGQTAPGQREPQYETLPPASQPEEQPAPEERRISLWSVAWLLAFAGAAAVCELQRRIRRKLRCPRRRKDPNGQALDKWREANLLAGRAQVTVPEELRTLAEKARFSQHTLTEEELERFDRFLEEARERLKEKPWYRRLVDRYLYALD